MMRINLLPHRQMKRAIRQREFGLMALMALGAACAVVFMGWTFLSAKKDSQLERNNRLEQAIVKLDAEIADINGLKDEISSLLERKQVVENLQVNRSESIIILDEITRQLPEGLYLKSIKQQGNLITLLGVADSQARIAALVSKLSASNWVESPNLIEIKASIVNGIKQNDFTMNVSLKAQKAETAPDNKKIGAQK